MNPLELVLGAVATWRISHMLLNENGPFEVFRHAREMLGVQYSEFDESKVIAFKYEITTCIWCLSMWIGGFVTAGLWLWPGVFAWLLLPYVFSAFSVSWNHWHGLNK